MASSTVRMDYELVDQTRTTLLNGSQQLEDRLNQLVQQMTALNDGRGNWIQSFTDMKARWDRQMTNLKTVLNTTAEQLKNTAIAMDETDRASANSFGSIAV